MVCAIDILKQKTLLIVSLVFLLTLVSCSTIDISDTILIEQSNYTVYELDGFLLNVSNEFSCEEQTTLIFYASNMLCHPTNSTTLYSITVDGILSASSSLANESFMTTHLSSRSSYYDTSCEEFESDKLNLDANYYVCSYLQDQVNMYSLGIIKSYDGFTRWFEIHMSDYFLDSTTLDDDEIELNSKAKFDEHIILENSSLDELPAQNMSLVSENPIQVLVDFTQQSISVDWNSFAP